jgi:hypothetical protein
MPKVLGFLLLCAVLLLLCFIFEKVVNYFFEAKYLEAVLLGGLAAVISLGAFYFLIGVG